MNVDLKIILQRSAIGLGGLIIPFALLVTGAGGFNYLRAWMFLGYSFIQVVFNSIILAGNPSLSNERLAINLDVKKWDRSISLLSTLSMLMIYLVSGFDGGRHLFGIVLDFKWCIFGYLLLTAGYLISNWAMFVNNFYSTFARIQTERDHTVITDGPYKWVRHPGYLGIILVSIGIPLALGSLVGLIPALLLVILVITRTGLEDEMLALELAGYSDYQKTTTKRLLPLIW